MNTVNKKPNVLPIKPSWEGMAKMLIVLLQSEKVDNVNFAKEEIIKMGVHLDELEKAGKKAVGALDSDDHYETEVARLEREEDAS